MTVTEYANAKINLFLDITGRREDGYHDIVSVMQSVSLCDTVTVTSRKSDKINITLICDDPSIPTDENNLIYKATLKYLTYFDICAEVKIILNKLIPIGAGLGGGSSDGAATLRALNRIFGFATEAELMKIAAELGSDVPFCLIGGKALCTGRGEKLETISDYPLFNLVIAIGKERISTPAAFRALDARYNNFADRAYSAVHCIGQPYNLFESITDIPEILKIKEIMTKSGAEYVLMSGSGPAVFGKFKNEEEARLAEIALINEGFSAYNCHTVKGAL